MSPKDKKISNWKLAFVASTVYVVLGTVYAYYAVDNMISDGVLYVLLYPVSFLPQLILFSESNPIVYVLISQLMTVPIMALIVWLHLKLLRKE